MGAPASAKYKTGITALEKMLRILKSEMNPIRYQYCPSAVTSCHYDFSSFDRNLNLAGQTILTPGTLSFDIGCCLRIMWIKWDSVNLAEDKLKWIFGKLILNIREYLFVSYR